VVVEIAGSTVISIHYSQVVVNQYKKEIIPDFAFDIRTKIFSFRADTRVCPYVFSGRHTGPPLRFFGQTHGSAPTLHIGGWATLEVSWLLFLK